MKTLPSLRPAKFPAPYCFSMAQPGQCAARAMATNCQSQPRRSHCAYLAFMVIIFSLALSACSSGPEPQDEFERLTQADLDNYISALSDPALAEANREEEAVAKVLKTHGLTIDRFGSIYIKIFMCNCLLAEESEPDFECNLDIFDKDIQPDETELELYRNSKEALDRANELSFQHRRAFNGG